MCGIVGYTGPREAGPILIEGLRRLEYRGYDSAGIALVDEDGDLFVEKQAGKLANLHDGDRRPDAARRDRPGPHPLGDPRPAERPQRPSPPGLHRRHHGHPQRDHRELPRAARRARGARPHADVGDRHRGDRPPRRGGLPGRPGRRGPGGAPPARGRLRARRDAQGRDQPARRGPPGRAADRRAERRGELHRQRRRGDPRPHQPGRLPRGGRRRRRPADRRRDHRHRRRAARAGRDDRSTWTPEAAEKGGYEHFMLKEIHEQPEALRQSIAGRVDPRRPDPASRSSSRSPTRSGRSTGSSSSPAAARTTPSLVGAAAIQDWTGHAGPGDRRLGVPLQPAAARRADARHRRDPVGRDGRHDRPDPPRPRAGLPDRRRDQHGRLGDHPRGRRGRVPPGRARRSRSPRRRRS